LYEAAHKLDEDIYEDPAPRAPKAERRRSLNESAHKLGRWPVRAAPTPETAKPPRCFRQRTAHRAAARTTVAAVYGVASLIFWALTIVVSIKYAGFIMRAHDRGDGGADGADSPSQGGASGRPRDARRVRRGAVLRGRDHHAGDLRNFRCRRTERRGAQPVANQAPTVGPIRPPAGSTVLALSARRAAGVLRRQLIGAANISLNRTRNPTAESSVLR
jgi:K+ potassium transporter